MGALTDVLGLDPRVRVLEVFAQNPEERLTARDVIEMGGPSRRSAYQVLKLLTEEGILIQSADPARKVMVFRLNHNDVRAHALEMVSSLFALGGLEANLKSERGVEQSEPLEGGILSDSIIFLRKPTVLVSALESLLAKELVANAGTLSVRNQPIWKSDVGDTAKNEGPVGPALRADNLGECSGGAAT